MIKTVKINSLPIGSTFKLSSGKTGTLIKLSNMGAMVQYPGKRATYVSGSTSVVLSESTEPSWVFDDGGREEAGYKGFAGDCVCRSIAIATKKPYKEVYDRLADGMANQRKSKRTSKQPRSARNGIYVKRKWFKDYMAELGFVWVSTSGIGQGFKAHLNSDELPNGRLVVSKKRHYTAFIDGVLRDTYDCSWDGKVGVYGYWLLKN
jgi:hypothetical protein